jgi:tripartite-type tricarboxylate transporter receptor subunit TctC
MISRRRLITISAAAMLAPAVIGRASAQTFPNRIVKLVVPFPPGGGTDAIARVLSAKLSEIWGYNLVVENRGGGATNIGTEQVVRADPDGYTVLFQSMPLTVNRFLFPNLTFDPLNDLAPVVLIGDYPNIMAVPMSSPAHSVKEFIAYANANKGKISFASSGHGTSVHLSGELFKRMAKVELLHVPYRGAGPAFSDLIPGRVHVMFNNTGAVLPLIAGKQLRGLAVTSAKRSPLAPQFHTIAEEGVPGFDVTSWYGIFAPAKTPSDVVRKMNADFVAAIRDPVIKSRLDQLGVSAIASTPAELGAFLRREMEKWGPVIKEAGITGAG